MRRHRTAIALAFLAACLVGVGLWAILRPAAFDWTGDVTVRGKRASLRVTRVMLEPWSYVDGGAPGSQDILAHRRFKCSPDQFFLYKEYRLQIDDASADEVKAVYQLIVWDAGRDLGGHRPGVVVSWSEGDKRCEVTSPVIPRRHLLRGPNPEVSQVIDFRDGSKERLKAPLVSDR